MLGLLNDSHLLLLDFGMLLSPTSQNTASQRILIAVGYLQSLSTSIVAKSGPQKRVRDD